LRSVNSIVIAPARTGNDNNSKKAVIKDTQTKRGILWNHNPPARILIIVVIKFIAPAIEAPPAKCKLKIAMSTAAPLCATASAKGGYTVQPVPTPPSTKLDVSSRISAGGKSQKLKLFKRGKAMSGAPNNNGRK
jgi:hypothetical protein